ncbi:MAG: hypothetical protein ABSG63_00395 [Spirochaetia bacterium]|jgi:hypothetical protein
MRRYFWLALLLGLIVSPVVFADIADNFMAGGIALTGSGSLSDNMGDPTNSSNQYNHLTITISPSAAFYLIDFLAFTVSPSFTYASNYTDSGNHIPSLSYALSVGLSWYPMFDPAHLFQQLPGGGYWLDPKSWMYNPNFPLVLNFGFAVGLTLNQYLPGVYNNGSKTFDGSMQFNVRLTPALGIYYFISERYALDLILNPNVNFPIGIYDSTGSPTNAVPANGFQVTFSASVGITLFIPWGERSLFKK